MDILYCPWRSKYVADVANTLQKDLSQEACVFCTKLAEHQDEQHFVLRRFSNVVVMLNLYPYNAGHLLVIPLAHVMCLSELDAVVRQEIMEVTSASITILKKLLRAQGINVGMNIYQPSGAGLPGHLHQHVLPRWSGDTNFLPLLSGTKQISVDLKDIYRTLKPEFDILTI